MHRLSIQENIKCYEFNSTSNETTYRDALGAKQRSLALLRSAIGDLTSTNIDVVLAPVTLLIELERMASGRETWIHHTNGAKALIKKLYGPEIPMQSSVSPLRSFLISNCLM